MPVRLVPRDVKFYEMFTEMAQNATEGARLLTEILRDDTDVATRVQRLKAIEHRGDDMTHELLTKLNQTFITPFDREDIHKLATSIGDVLDFVWGAGERLVIYKVSSPPPAAAELASIIVRQCEELTAAVSLLEKNQRLVPHLVEINRLENEADLVSRGAIGALFEYERDPITLIKIKELFEVLERATDKVEDAANVLEAVVLKST
jgi:predicted phosphate transport protein (TIGR00153 family)